MLKEGTAGVAFEIPVPTLPTLGPQKPKRISRLEAYTTLRNREFDAESFMRRLDEKQRTAYERREVSPVVQIRPIIRTGATTTIFISRKQASALIVVL